MKVAIILLTAGALLVLLALRGFDLRQRRAQTLAAGERRAENLALITSEHLRSTFAAADAVMRQLRAFSRQVGGPAGDTAQWDAILEVSRTRLNSIGSLSILDRDGVVRHSTYARMQGESRGDTPLFQHLTEQPRNLLMSDEPYESRATPGLMLVPLARRLATTDGKFDGAVWAIFNPQRLRDFFRTFDVGYKGSISVFHPGGHVLIHVAAAGDLGNTASGHPLFEAAAKAGRGATGRLVFPDGAERIASFQQLGEPRLFVAVALDRDELLVDWWREVWITVAVTGVAVAALVVGLWVLFRQFDARAATEEVLTQSRRLESIGKFTGGVAHDFNNLLTIILMNTSLLRMRDGSTEVVQIEGAAMRAAELTRKLLTFARKQPLQPTLVDLNQLVRALEPMLARVLGEDIELELEIPAGAGRARIDRTQAENAIINLCVNARDAMPRGGRLRIETEELILDERAVQANADVMPGPHVVISVRDTGTGIAPEHLPRVFEPFFTTKEVGKGTGLGLSSVYGFVRQSGGHVEIESELGHGTVVRLYFPRAEPESSPATPLLAAAPAGRGESVLVVEDEPVVRELATITLRQLGYNVCAAADGAQALTLARQGARLDVLVTDVVLPGGMNGRQVADEVQRLRPGVRVVYASGYSDEVIQTRGELAPGLKLLTKPYDPQQLARALHEALQPRQ